ncbi:MAG: TM2 domain-containing protein [Clostridiales bacterium]|nr:TM2 domain-containing protein [Clostridiales bacterium]
MDATKVDMFLTANREYFLPNHVLLIKERMLQADESKYSLISMMEFKNPTTILIMSVLLGSLGVDRFMLGDTGMGVLKLLTCGVCGILTIIDWFSVSKKAKEKNFQTIMEMLL